MQSRFRRTISGNYDHQRELLQYVADYCTGQLLQVRTCGNCKQPFAVSENNPRSCNYHKGRWVTAPNRGKSGAFAKAAVAMVRGGHYDEDDPTPPVLEKKSTNGRILLKSLCKSLGGWGVAREGGGGGNVLGPRGPGGGA